MSLANSRLAPVEEVIHGALVRDPYRWLEDRTLPETEDWIREQQRRCEAYFAECEELPAIRERVREYLDIDVIDQPAKVGNRYFYRHRRRGQEQGSIYVRDAVSGMERLLVDPSGEGPFVSVGIHRLSNDGSLLAYERKCGGEDKKSIHVVNVENGAGLPCTVDRGYARGFVFCQNNEGLFYCQDTPGNAGEHSILFHSLEQQVPAQMIFRMRRSHGSRLTLTADSIHLGAVCIHDVDGELLEDLWIARQDNPTDWHRVFANKRLPYTPILKNGRLFAISYENAPNGKIIELRDRGEELRTIIPDQGAMVHQLAFSESHIYISFLQSDGNAIRSWNLAGAELAELALPKDGSVQLLPTYGDGASLFVDYETFTQPQVTFEYNCSTHASDVWYERQVTRKPQVAVRQEFSSGADGVMIPITLINSLVSGSALSGHVIMTSYGGFGVAMTPRFSVFATILMECGAVLAIPHIRGGGEYGPVWHDSGCGKNKATSINDFITATERLCHAGVTTPQRLAIFGGSNSGLLVGAAMTKRPELFRAVLCIAPLLDMIRYEHFDQAAKWRSEYGSVQNADELHALAAYSPYHAVRDGVEYPAVLFVSGDKDDRCNPAHVRKMAARMIDASSVNSTILVDYDDERGHSPTLPLSTRVDALSRRIAFLCKELKLPFASGGIP